MCRFHKNGPAALPANPYRLAPDVVPSHYKLQLEPDLAKATFSGEVTISVNVKAPTSEITLNAIELAIQSAIITRADGTAFTGSVTLDEATQRAHLKVNGTIGKGEWKVTLHFTGILNDKLRGFYRSTYQDESGQTQVIATTQFQASDARRCFPCFDEPAFKATFEISLLIEKDLVAVSNGHVISITDNPSGKKLVAFATTMKMSTYIVAFAVGKLSSTQTVNVDGVAVRFWCVPGKEHLAALPLEAAQFALRYFAKFFGVPYPSNKLDLLAIPDFSSGAMENFACIMFHESVLIDVSTAAQSSLDWAVKVVCHEIAHMWFGDLVTMEWWEGLWLNESFATLMEIKCTDAFRKEWKVWDAFGLSRESAFRVDALESTRPIEYPVTSPDDAAAMVDVLTYEKGCSVVRMLEQFMGEATFQKGIAQYISSHLYGNTKTGDLWAALESASSMPVSSMMQGWIFAGGFPLVSVKLAAEAGSIELSQRSFKFLSEAVDPEQKWIVPIMLRAKTAQGIVETKLLLDKPHTTIHLGSGLEWVVVNAGGHGFYRTHYSTELQNQLTANPGEALTVLERANFLGDAWACVESGANNCLEFIELAKRFAADSDPTVWTMITRPLATMRYLLPKDQRQQFEGFCRELLAAQVKRLGISPIPGESSQQKELRGRVLHCLALTGNDPAMQDKATELYAKWLDNKEDVDGDVIDTVVAVVATTIGDSALHDEFYRLYKDSATSEEESMFLSGLACFDDHDLARRSLKLCLDPEAIRTQDSTDVIAGLLGNEATSELAWQFVKDHWKQLVDLLPEGMLVYVVRELPSLDTPEQEADARAFFASHSLPGAGKQLDQALETQRVAVVLRQREAPVLASAFTKQADNTLPVTPAGT